MREITYAEAIREALRHEMTLDDNVFIFGEDVGAFGGCFGVTAGLYDKIGPERVMPISCLASNEPRVSTDLAARPEETRGEEIIDILLAKLVLCQG